MNKRLPLVISMILLSLSSYANNTKTDSLWKVLKAELGKANTYIHNKEQKIQSMRNQLAQSQADGFDPRYKLLSEIFEEYKAFKFDSAITNAHQMIAIAKKFNKKQYVTKSQMLLATVLLKSGFYKEAFDAMATVDTNNLSKQLRYDYLTLRGLLNNEISIYNNDAYFAQRYREASKHDFDNASNIIEINEFEATINLAFLPNEGDRKKPNVDFFYHYILNHGLSQHEIAMVATRISHAYENDDKLLLLTLAAINDIRSATKETFAIFLLGQELFKRDRNNDAYLCMQESLNNAAFYGTRHRASQIESLLPLITSRLIKEEQHEKNILWIGIIISLFVALVVIFQMYLFRKQMIRIKKIDQIIKDKNAELEDVNIKLSESSQILEDVNAKLWESSRIKEELIGLFFKTCSSYIETLDKVKRKAQHNIKLGKYQDASQILGNVQIQTEKNRLFSTLDRVFLTLFPNFVAAFNSLLKQEDQIWLKEGEMMTATLRIFALIRLGLNDVETIAKILDYTVNTVYTYKARIKGKSLVPPELFEQKIMDIKFTDKH